MSVEANLEVVREFTRIFKNEHNVEGVDHLFHRDFEHHFRRDVPAGLDGFKVIGRAMNGAFPDVRVSEQDLFGCGAKVVERSSAIGTHRGELFGFPATGCEVYWSEIHIYEFKRSKIIRHWVEWSESELLKQIQRSEVS